MEFHLVYQGRLPAASQSNTRARDKQDMRKVFHKQLVNLWATQSFLRTISNDEVGSIATKYAHSGFRFVPRVSSFFTVACALDILFLRRDGPGSIVKSGGDIDNRINTASTSTTFNWSFASRRLQQDHPFFLRLSIAEEGV